MSEIGEIMTDGLPRLLLPTIRNTGMPITEATYNKSSFECV